MSEVSQKTRSRVSRSSRLSHRSRASEAGALARAEAEAMKAQIVFAEEEAKIKQEKARIEASLEVLSLKKSAAAATAKAQVLEAALETDDDTSDKPDIQLDLKHETAIQRTEEYVREHSQILHQPDPISEDGNKYPHSSTRFPLQTSSQQQNASCQDPPFTADLSFYAPPMRNSSGQIFREDPAMDSKRLDTPHHCIDPPDCYSYPMPPVEKGTYTCSSDARMIPPVNRYPDSSSQPSHVGSGKIYGKTRNYFKGTGAV
ncbi:uncharacterized protein LOC122935372 [Bufo gargarizans]|uniref:uncharacterized protein LOC122935372 n=1 Tax=Bufo gargarizans TaxID=30331 RepID=UPI001CF353A4|nr:uncharacterized protein LOC122935372 [Bufo gargarizans]